MSLLPWNERVVSFQINPESASNDDVIRMAEELHIHIESVTTSDIARMAEELVELWKVNK